MNTLLTVVLRLGQLMGQLEQRQPLVLGLTQQQEQIQAQLLAVLVGL